MYVNTGKLTIKHATGEYKETYACGDGSHENMLRLVIFTHEK